MKVVIDMPDGCYEELCNGQFPVQDAYRLVAWIKDGTPLPNDRWVPVSERLPEDSGYYLITIADSNYKNGRYYKISWFFPSKKEWSYRNATIIAWMPLPEPYKEIENDI